MTVTNSLPCRIMCKKKFSGVIVMTVEERFQQTDFSKFSRIKDALFLRLKLRRQAINEDMMSFVELDSVVAAGNPALNATNTKHQTINSNYSLE